MPISSCAPMVPFNRVVDRRSVAFRETGGYSFRNCRSRLLPVCFVVDAKFHKPLTFQ